MVFLLDHLDHSPWLWSYSWFRGISFMLDYSFGYTKEIPEQFLTRQVNERELKKKDDAHHRPVVG